MRVYTYKGCSSCKKATAWLDAAGFEYEELPIRETPPTVAELRQMLGYVDGDLRKLFNTAGGDYRELNMKVQLPQLSEPEALDLLASRGNLVKRPFLWGKNFGCVGFNAEVWQGRVVAG
ncbi:MAG: arsenate reductase [Lentimonas sp.]|jgi:arsenate reductase